ncbi:MAG: hypothetical protein V3U75_06490 [Methylococcaceae bacterium]
MILDAHLEILSCVENDIQTIKLKDARGQKSMSVETVPPCAILKQHHQLTYEDLSFTLLGSHSYKTIARLTDGFVPKKSVLQGAISRMARQAAADGDYASKKNWKVPNNEILTMLPFSKKRGLEILDRAKNPWVFRKFRNFRAGIETGIS